MSVEVIMDTPLAQSLNSVIQPKLIEVGWSSGGGDESQLAEYILLMLANNKTQEQIAAELSSDLLGLGPDDPGARDFSQWLFQQIEVLSSQHNGTDGPATTGDAQGPPMQDAEMGDISVAGEGKVYVISTIKLSQPDIRLPLKPPKLTHSTRPTGPKSMRDGPGASRPRDKRMLGHLAKAMDRTNESVLHRIRPQNGNERINTHSRAPPTGPRQQASGRGGIRNSNSRMNGHAMGGMPMQQGAVANNLMNMSPQQQLELYSMLEQQSRLMAQMLGPHHQMAMGRGGNMGSGFQQPQPGRSLFDRVPQNQRLHNGPRKFPQNDKFGGQQSHPRTGSDAASSSMDVEMSQEKKDLDPENTKCRFNLQCTMKDCKFAHQSPAAPSGAAIDFKDVCAFGAACKNKKCTGKHPSPSQKAAYQTAQQCRWGSDCTNPNCTFIHPTPCRNGGDCAVPNCKFGHTKIVCKFNPCERPSCTFKHVEDQKRGKFADKVWTPDSAKEHVSERKFVDEGAPEELIVPGASDAGLNRPSIKPGVIA
ncbi:hypothetical protein B2J93_2645 [Marssonina coronariae]|uniref:Nab2-like CCCH zinc finger domain-containing protein n=1 Tax=Diplocarpon coronariae TaxID=2795749 RepID=A0A218Z868_9HELO|nr:hypothetical protein B2J93_2645 [Marssonina coronariae]